MQALNAFFNGIGYIFKLVLIAVLFAWAIENVTFVHQNDEVLNKTSQQE